MKDKSTLIFAMCCLLGCYVPAGWAQLRFNVYSGGYFNITDYAGYTAPEEGHRFHIQYQGQDINEPQWGIRARINGPIRPESGQNISGLPFPAEKLGFQFTHDGGERPTLAEIGATMATIPFNALGETILIGQSNVPIRYQSPYGGSMQFHLYFTMHVAGGAYLDQMKNSAAYQIIVYSVPITFTLYDHAGNILGSQDVVYRVQVNQTLTGAPSVEPVYGLEVLGEAREGTLEFGNVNNYMGGVSMAYQDGLKVNANTGYAVAVKTVGPEMVSQTGRQATLPVSVVNLRLQPGSNPPQSGNYTEVALSDGYQVLFTTNTGRDVPQFFNIVYSTAANDERLLKASSGTYTTVVLYQLLPQ